MAETATAKQGTALEVFKAELLSPERAEPLWASLPRHINKDRFERNLTNALMQSPDLLKEDPRLVYREVSRVAALGLLLEKDLGEAYLIIAWNGKTRRPEPQARIGYRGLIKLAKQSGKIKKINAREVREHDRYYVRQGTTEELVHEPALSGDRGEVMEYYAVVTMTDGETDFERMTLEEVHGIRDRSDAWKAFRDGKIKLTPWATDEGEMAKKTVIRRLCKRLEQSPELSEAIRIEDEAEFAHLRDVTPTTSRPTLVAPSAPKPELVAPSPGKARPQPKGGQRSATPYREMGTTKKADFVRVRFTQEESEKRLQFLIEALGEPLTSEGLMEVVELNRPTVAQMVPEHQEQAEEMLKRRAEEILEGPDLPSFLEEADATEKS